MDIRTKTAIKAVHMLEASGCRYHVIDATGHEFGGPLEPAPKKVHRVKKHNFKSTGYIDRLRTITPGQVIEFLPPDGATATDFQKAVIAKARMLYGLGSCTSTVNNGVVELLRVS